MESVPLSSAGINQVSIFLVQGLPPQTEQKQDCITGCEKAIPLPSYNTCLSQGDLLHMDYVENRAEISLRNPDPWTSGHFCPWAGSSQGCCFFAQHLSIPRSPVLGCALQVPGPPHHPELGSEQRWEQQSERKARRSFSSQVEFLEEKTKTNKKTPATTTKVK